MSEFFARHECNFRTETKRLSKLVLEWLDAQDEAKLFLIILTLGEIKKGITRLESEKKKATLEKWLEQLRARFSRRILPITKKTFLVWGKMYGEFERKDVRRSIRFWKQLLWNTM